MAPRDRSHLRPLDAWQVEQFRFTAFPVVGTKIDSSSWWADVVGSPPDSISNQPKQGIQAEQGTLGPGRGLVLQIQPDRIEWRLAANEEAESVFGDPLGVGSVPLAADAFFGGVVRRWLPHCPAVVRLAVGGILRLPVTDGEAGYRQLDHYLEDVRVTPSTTSDFLYQINKPRPSRTGVVGLQINRLMRWSLSRLHALEVHVKVPPGTHALSSLPATTSQSEPRFACRLQFDINTAPSSALELPADRVGDIVDELIGLAFEIVESGDIP